MDVLVKLLTLASMSDIPNLRKMLNLLETSVPNLADLN